ncbi:MAG: SGNH/GDSL hydrolase family protein, partial [Gammaproteobacteria bacterium]|nr:SGNH/GDSL hydrolase family protein [Gammaproteobacteria bacterium]
MSPAGRLLAHATVLLTPVLYLQGMYTRMRIRRLPEASGNRQGRVQGDSQVIRVLLLGESTVAGVGASTHELGLAGRIGEAITAMTGASVKWQVLAANGLTASGVRAKMRELPDGTRADLVVIGIGANDVFRLQGPGGWEREIRALIDTARDRVGFAPVMLSAMPPIGKFPGLPQPLRSVLGLRAKLLDHSSEKLAADMTGVTFVPLQVEVTP